MLNLDSVNGYKFFNKMHNAPNSFVALLFFLAVLSCSNEESITSPLNRKSIENQTLRTSITLSPVTSSNLSTNSAPGGENAVVTYINGHYVTSFGGGIDFGTSFPHPVSGSDGQSVPIPNGAVFTGGDAIVDTFGEHLVVILQNPRKYGSGEISVYLLNGEIDIETSDVGGFQNPATAGKIITDHTSPTNMSVVSEAYTANLKQSGTTVTVELGTLTLSGANYDLYALSQISASGTVYEIIGTKVSDGTSIIIGGTSSLTYQRKSDGNFLIHGTLVSSLGTYTVNTTILDGI